MDYTDVLRRLSFHDDRTVSEARSGLGLGIQVILGAVKRGRADSDGVPATEL